LHRRNANAPPPGWNLEVRYPVAYPEALRISHRAPRGNSQHPGPTSFRTGHITMTLNRNESAGRVARAPRRRRPFRGVFDGLEPRLLLAIDVLMYHNGPTSTGSNTSETQLTPSNVNSSTFGKLFQVQVDGQVYAQPLVATGVNITTGASPGIHDVVFVATEND